MKTMIDEVRELKAYYEEKGVKHKVKECEELLQLCDERKMLWNDWAEMKRLADINRIRTQIGEFAMY